jgi:hypothetical protein
MDIFEKQQRIESINGIIKVRWFIAVIIIGLGFLLKIKYFGWTSGFSGSSVSAYIKLGVFGAVAFGYNFIFWLFVRWLARKPIEKISDRVLNIMSVLQIIPDQLMFTFVYYNTGTVDSMSFVFYFISVFLVSSLYRSRGIILTGALAGFLYTGLLIIEYQGLIPHFNTYQGVTLFGSDYVIRGKIVTFICYIGVMTFVSAFLSNLIRNREKKLREKSDQLSGQTQKLTVQTQELTQTKNYLHEALTKSDKARGELERTKADLEKANLELRAKLDEVEKYGEVTTGRELKMIELKDKIRTLEQRITELEKDKN